MSQPASTPNPHRAGLVDGTVTALRARVTSGEWPVGARIPPEPALVSLLGVGRNTVREAVQALVHAGLLERRQGSGTYVLADDELGVTIGRYVAGADQRDVLQVRRALEVETARLAAVRRSEAEADELLGLRSARAAAWATGDEEQMVATDVALHLYIARIAHNALLLGLYENLLEAIMANIRANVAEPTQADGAHETLVDAIVAGDAVRAVREVEAYLAPLLGERAR